MSAGPDRQPGTDAAHGRTARGLAIRIALTAVALILWFWTQSLIGARSLPVSGVGDGMHVLTAPRAWMTPSARCGTEG